MPWRASLLAKYIRNYLDFLDLSICLFHKTENCLAIISLSGFLDFFHLFWQICHECVCFLKGVPYVLKTFLIVFYLIPFLPSFSPIVAKDLSSSLRVGVASHLLLCLFVGWTAKLGSLVASPGLVKKSMIMDFRLLPRQQKDKWGCLTACLELLQVQPLFVCHRGLLKVMGVSVEPLGWFTAWIYIIFLEQVFQRLQLVRILSCLCVPRVLVGKGTIWAGLFPWGNVSVW